MKERILIVEDDRRIRDMLRRGLIFEGYSVDTAEDGETALHVARETPPDAVILDIMLPKMDGLEVCRRIRRTMQVPILILSAKGETADRVVGLDVGADDYLSKPFDPTELLARVRAVLRRAEAFGFGDGDAGFLTVGNFRLDPVGNKVFMPSGKIAELTPIEFRLLHYLVRNAGRILSHDQVLDNVWGYGYDGYANQIAVYMRRLRSKIEVDPNNPTCLLTVRGLGYKFDAETA